MLLNKLSPATGSLKKPKRIGRGQGSGHGGTSTRGLNGAQSRAGYKRKLGYEGGQNPLYRRLPKFGFTSHVNNDFKCVNLDTLEELVKRLSINKVDPSILADHGLISNKSNPVKILGRGELKTACELHAHAFSKSALEAINKSGGSAHYIKTKTTA